MPKLITILKEILTELADTNKAFTYNKAEDRVKQNEDDPYLTGVLFYKFKTDTKLEYEVEVQYLGGHDEVYDHAQSGDGQMVEVGFYVEHVPSKNMYDTTNNPKELFRIMGTISKCIKDAYDEYKFKYLIYHPVADKGGERVEKGSNQRTKLYDYYIKKEFPQSDSKKEGKYIITTLE